MAAPKVVSALLITIVIASIGGIMNVTSTTEVTWCVAKSYARDEALQAQLEWACSHGADCGPIKPGGSCFLPNTSYNHASYAFNSYYQCMHRAPGTCHFGGTATVALTDPSLGNCRYPHPLKVPEEQIHQGQILQ